VQHQLDVDCGRLLQYRTVQSKGPGHLKRCLSLRSLKIDNSSFPLPSHPGVLRLVNVEGVANDCCHNRVWGVPQRAVFFFHEGAVPVPWQVWGIFCSRDKVRVALLPTAIHSEPYVLSLLMLLCFTRLLLRCILVRCILVRKPRRVTRTGFALSPQASKHRTHFQMLVEDESGRELLFDVPSVRGPCVPIWPSLLAAIASTRYRFCLRWMVTRASRAGVFLFPPPTCTTLPRNEQSRRSNF